MRDKKFIFFLLFAVLFFSFVKAGSEQTTSSSAIQINPARLNRIDTFFREHIHSGKLPGTVILLARNGKIAALHAMGMADVENHNPMKTDSIFRLASATKIFTAVALLILYEEGRFGLRDPVSTYIPEFRNLLIYGPSNNPEPLKGTLRIRDLLRHTSGFGYGYEDPQQRDYRKAAILASGPRLDWSHQFTLDEWVSRLSTVPLSEEPGTRFRYGLSSDILGVLIERISGQPLDQFMEARIFKPLKMKSTGFVVTPDQLSRLTTMYEIRDQKFIPIDKPATSPFRNRPKALSGGGGWDYMGNGGLVSSGPDIFRFLQMLINGGSLDGVQILSRKTVDLMHLNHLSELGSMDSLRPGVGFGFGYAVLYDSTKFGDVGSPGTLWWAGSTNVFYWMDPREKLIGVLMLQVQPFPYLDLMDVIQRLSLFALE